MLQPVTGKPGGVCMRCLLTGCGRRALLCGWMEPLQDGVGGEIGDCWVTGGWSCGEAEGREGVDDDGRTEGDQQDRMRIVGQCHVMRCCFLPAFSHCPQKPTFNGRWPSTKRKKVRIRGPASAQMEHVHSTAQRSARISMLPISSRVQSRPLRRKKGLPLPSAQFANPDGQLHHQCKRVTSSTAVWGYWPLSSKSGCGEANGDGELVQLR